MEKKNNMKRKMICTALSSILILSSLCGSAFADSNTEVLEAEELLASQVYEIDLDDPEVRAMIEEQVPDYFTQEHQDRIAAYQEDLREFEESYLQKLGLLRAIDQKNLNVANQKQQADSWCGLASAAQVSSFNVYGAGSTKVTQANIKTNTGYGDREDGLYVHEVTSALNGYLGNYKYESIGLWEATFSTAVISSIEKGRPVVAHVRSTALAPKYAPSTGHYIVITGYRAGFQGSNSVADVYYNDPYNNSSYFGSFTTTFSNMEAAIRAKSSYFVAAY